MIKKMFTRTLKAKEDIWLFSDNNGDQTHHIIRKGDKFKMFIDHDLRFGRTYYQSFGRMLAAHFNQDDLRLYGLIKDVNEVN